MARFEHQRAQVFAGHKIHHQVIAAANGEEIGYFGQVGVIQARKDSRLAQELLAGFAHQIHGKRAVVFDLFQGAQAPFKTKIIGQVDAAHAPLANDPANLITTAQDFPSFKRDWHSATSSYKSILQPRIFGSGLSISALKTAGS